MASPFGDYLKNSQKAFAASQPTKAAPFSSQGGNYASLTGGNQSIYASDAAYRQYLDFQGNADNIYNFPIAAHPEYAASLTKPSLSQYRDPYDLAAYLSGDPSKIAMAEAQRYNQSLNQLNQAFTPRITDEQVQFLGQLAPDLYRAYQSNPMLPTGVQAQNFTEWLNGQGGISTFTQHGDVGQVSGPQHQNYYVPTSDRDPNDYFRNWVNTLDVDAGTRGQLKGMANDAWAGYVAAKNADWYSYASFADYLKNLGPSGLATLGTSTTPDQTFLAWVAAQHLTPGSQQVLESRYAPVYAQYLAAQQQNPNVGSFTDYLKTVNINNQLSQVPQAGAPGGSQTYEQRLRYYGY